MWIYTSVRTLNHSIHFSRITCYQRYLMPLTETTKLQPGFWYICECSKACTFANVCAIISENNDDL